MSTESKKTCSIVGCENPSKKAMATVRISESIAKSGLRIKDSRSRKEYLCQEHWKKVKKVFKKDTKAERMRWGP
ncbi:MAG: hypothetical protein JSW61_04850 [Candidatus Thorarchaeota archaeon]|nr:MAG: hypothetical protein JSW61_04850 [Candidatus Thorarchaeota archaeon]